MIQPNTKFFTRKEEIKPINWALTTDTERANNITFEATCKKCIRIGGCHYEKIPCEYKKKIKKLIQILTIEQQMEYLRKIQTMKFEEIEKELYNIINIMEKEN